MSEFILREWREDDVPAVQRLGNNIKIAANLRDAFPFPYTLQNARDFIAACRDAKPGTQISMAIAVAGAAMDGEAAGSIGVFPKSDVYCRSAEIGYWLGEPYWGRGIMTEAVRRMCGMAFAAFPELVRLEAGVFSENIASQRVLEKAGFYQEGVLQKSIWKNSVFQDTCMYALLRN